jgi:hypothetical protein
VSKCETSEIQPHTSLYVLGNVEVGFGLQKYKTIRLGKGAKKKEMYPGGDKTMTPDLIVKRHIINVTIESIY